MNFFISQWWCGYIAGAVSMFALLLLVGARAKRRAI